MNIFVVHLETANAALRRLLSNTCTFFLTNRNGNERARCGQLHYLLH